MVPCQPAGKVRFSARQDLAADASRVRESFEGFFDRCNPVWRGSYVIVSKSKNRRARLGYASVAGVRGALFFLETIDEVIVTKLEAKGFHHAASLVGGVVIN